MLTRWSGSGLSSAGLQLSPFWGSRGHSVPLGLLVKDTSSSACLHIASVTNKNHSCPQRQVHPQVTGKWNAKLNYPYSSLTVCPLRKTDFDFIKIIFGIHIWKRKEILNVRHRREIQRLENIISLLTKNGVSIFNDKNKSY